MKSQRAKRRPTESGFFTWAECTPTHMQTYRQAGRAMSFFSFFNLFISVLPACTPTCQKRESDPSIGGCESVCSCWKWNSGPLKEQPVFLISEPSLGPLLMFSVFYFSKKNIFFWFIFLVIACGYMARLKAIFLSGKYRVSIFCESGLN